MPLEMKDPGVYREEIDESLVPSVDNTTVIGTIGRAKRGIANSVVLVNSEDQLIKTFGTPICSGSYPVVKDVDYGIYSGIEALKETNNLLYVRATNGTEKYASVSFPLTSAGLTTSAGTTSAIATVPSSAYPSSEGYATGNRPNDIYDLNSMLNSSVISIASVGPGVYGNNLAVTITTSAVSALSSLSGNYNWGYKYGDEAKSKRIFKIDVFEKKTSESFTNGMVPVETYFVSNDVTDIDNSGNSLYVEDVINGVSPYIYVKASGTGVVPPSTCTSSALVKVALDGGSDGTSVSYTAEGLWGFFENKETTPLDVAIVLPRSKDDTSTTGEIGKINTIVGKRLDFVAVTQASKAASKSEASIRTDNTDIQSSISNYSYFAKYVGWNLVYDRYNASRVQLPNCIYAANVIARTDRLSNPWEAPAGKERGVIAAGKQNVDLTKDIRGKLYDELNLNCIKFFAGVGNVIWGQKTTQLQQTARDRLNVRRMLITIEDNVEAIMNNFVFRGNTVKERERAYTLANSYMSTVLAKGGVQSYQVVCDETNNTTATIAANQLNVDIKVQPTYTIEYVKISTTISSSSVSVGEG